MKGKIPELQELVALNLACLHDGVRVPFLDALALAIDATHLSASKEKVFIDSHELLPKLLLVQNVRREDFCGDAPGEILDTLSNKTAVDRSVVAMSLGVSLLEEGQPSLVGVTALGKVESCRSDLHHIAVSIVWIFPVVNLQPLWTVAGRLVKVFLDEVKLVVNDLGDPLAIWEIWSDGVPFSWYRGNRVKWGYGWLTGGAWRQG